MTLRATRYAAAILGFAFFCANGTTATLAAGEKLPWGTTAVDPQVITPSTTYDPGPVEPSQDYDTSSGSYDDNTYDNTQRKRRNTDRYQDDPDYSTYTPADPGQEWSDEDDGLYDDQKPARTRKAQRRVPIPDSAGNPAPSRFDGTFSANEIVEAGNNAFGQVARGFAGVVEYAFRKQGRPNGYIIGQEAGGAIVAGLRYGEGILHTKKAGQHVVYWQGPSVGYDFGAEGSKTMILVYNIRRPSDVYGRFGGIDGSAYLVGGVGVTFQQNRHVTMAPIRSGIGLRLGANIGYLKYSRVPTWNPF